jgi:hypothetical protein
MERHKPKQIWKQSMKKFRSKGIFKSLSKSINHKARRIVAEQFKYQINWLSFKVIGNQVQKVDEIQILNRKGLENLVWLEAQYNKPQRSTLMKIHTQDWIKSDKKKKK